MNRLLHTLAPELNTRLFLAELAGHVWAARPDAVEALFAELAGVLPHARAFGGGEPEQRPYAVKGRQARVSIRGMMLPSGPRWLGAYFAICEQIVESIRAAHADADVDEIVLEVDSPGGVILGVEALAETIAQSTKPVTAYVLHQCASAAYWVASQASRIVARPGAMVGSIGVFAVVTDASKAYEEAGVKVHVLRSGFFKGAGVSGAPLSEKQLAEFEARVERGAELFRGAVMAGRKMDAKTLAPLATGQDWDAAKAIGLGLIDEIENMRSTAGAAPKTGMRGESVPTEESCTMTKEEEEALRAELAREKAENAAITASKAKADADLAQAMAAHAAMAASVAAVDEQRKAAILDEHTTAGRVTPANRAEFDAYAKTVTPEQLGAFVAKMPVITRPAPSGGSGPEQRGTGAAAVSPTDAKLFDALSISTKEIEQYGDAIGLSFDGQTVMLADGTTRKAVN